MTYRGLAADDDACKAIQGTDDWAAGIFANKKTDEAA